MQQNCAKCGEVIGEGKKFCPACGAKAESEPKPQPQLQPQPQITLTLNEQPEPEPPKTQPAAPPPPAPAPAPVRTPPPAYNTPNPVNIAPADADPIPPKGSKYAPVGKLIYMLLMIAMSLPFLGFIFALIFSFAGKSVSRKNFARAVLIFMIIGIVLAIIGGLISWFVIGPVIQTFIEGLFNMINDLTQSIEMVPLY
jgi:hypothetical protein